MDTRCLPRSKQSVRAKSSESRVSFMEFMREYPDDATCLITCGAPGTPRTARMRSARSASRCARSSGTRRSSAPVVDVYRLRPPHPPDRRNDLPQVVDVAAPVVLAIYLVSSSRCGIAAKQLERELGVNYKTALRMLHLIREDLMEQDDDAAVGRSRGRRDVHRWKAARGRAAQAARPGHRQSGPATKTARRGVRSRRARRQRPRHRRPRQVAQRRALAKVHEFVLPGSMVFTDDWGGYSTSIGRRTGTAGSSTRSGSTSRATSHADRSKASSATSRPTCAEPTTTISTRWLPGYLNEWVWKWNHRNDDEADVPVAPAKRSADGLDITSSPCWG